MQPIIDKVAWIRSERGRMLCARSRDKDAYRKHEHGESDLDTLSREIAEELGVRIFPEKARPAGIFEAPADGRADGVIVRMTCYTADYTGALAAAGEIAEVAWLGHADRDRVSAVVRIIFDRLRAHLSVPK